MTPEQTGLVRRSVNLADTYLGLMRPAAIWTGDSSALADIIVNARDELNKALLALQFPKG